MFGDWIIQSEKELRKKIKSGFFSTNGKGEYTERVLYGINSVAETVLKWVLKENPQTTIVSGYPSYTVTEIEKIFEEWELHDGFCKEGIAQDANTVQVAQFISFIKDKSRVEEILNEI